MSVNAPAVIPTRDLLRDVLSRVRLLSAAAVLAPDPAFLRAMITEAEPALGLTDATLAKSAPEALLALRRAAASARAGRADDSHTELLIAHGHLAAALHRVDGTASGQRPNTSAVNPAAAAGLTRSSASAARTSTSG